MWNKGFNWPVCTEFRCPNSKNFPNGARHKVKIATGVRPSGVLILNFWVFVGADGDLKEESFNSGFYPSKCFSIIFNFIKWCEITCHQTYHFDCTFCYGFFFSKCQFEHNNFMFSWTREWRLNYYLFTKFFTKNALQKLCHKKLLKLLWVISLYKMMPLNHPFGDDWYRKSVNPFVQETRFYL